MFCDLLVSAKSEHFVVARFEPSLNSLFVPASSLYKIALFGSVHLVLLRSRQTCETALFGSALFGSASSPFRDFGLYSLGLLVCAIWGF